MRGFMCHSSTATAVCMANDPRSVIVPRRPRSGPPDRNINLIDDHARLINNSVGNHYSRFIKNHSHSRSSITSTFLPSIKSQQDFHPQEPKPPNPLISKPPPQVASSDHVFQVVVMRVSLHCQGCAGKLKKHLSKMEGVTSFSIDLETKRVTVMGHVSPTRVLESTSKVKKAEFWPF